MIDHGETKNEHGQVIQRHIVNFDNLLKASGSPPNRKNIFASLQKEEDDEKERKKKTKATRMISKGIGFEFQSFQHLRQKIYKETDQVRAIHHKPPVKDRENLVGTMRKSSQKIVGSMMQKVVAARLRDYYSLPVSNNSVSKIPIVEISPIQNQDGDQPCEPIDTSILNVAFQYTMEEQNEASRT